MTKIPAIEGERAFPMALDVYGREYPVLPDDFPFEEDRESVLGIPVLSFMEYYQLRRWHLEHGPLAPVMFGPNPERLYTWCGIPIIHERDAAVLRDAMAIMESARRQWTGRPRDWSRATHIFKALTGRENDDENPSD
jgi:hypothetical protein